MGNFNDIAYLVALALSVLNAIITFVRTGTLKKEYKNMLYRSPDYQDYLSDEEKQKQAQEFPNIKTEYVLNKHTNELEEKESKTDLQSLINSSVDTALDRVLQRLLPDGDDLQDTLESDYVTYGDDLIDFADMLDRAEEYREKFNLPLEMSVEDIFKRVQTEADGLKSRIANLNKVVKPVKEPAKEIVENETQKIE